MSVNPICDLDCLHCKFSDCINDEISYAELSAEDENIEVSRERKLARARANRYSENHREELRKKSLDYYYKNREKVINTTRQWQKDNPLRVSARKEKIGD